MKAWIPLLALSSMLTACGGGTNGASTPSEQRSDVPSSSARLDQIPLPPACVALPAGSTVEFLPDPTCLICTGVDESLAIDGDRETYATLTSPPAGYTGKLRVTAPPGVVFAALNQPGAFVSRPGVLVEFAVYTTTYLDGQQQEQWDLSGIAGTGTGEDYYSLPATKPFNAIEMSARRVFGPGEFHVTEFCVDGGF